jgi:hypothetical protein
MSKSTELTLAAETKIIKNNLDPFSKMVKKFIKNVPTKLTSDEDFENAKDFVKKAKEFETQIVAAQDRILNSGELADITKAVQELKQLVSSKRLEVNKIVTEADRNKKDSMIRAAREKIEKAINNSPMSRFLDVDYSDLSAQIKNKRSYKVMETTLEKYASMIILDVTEQTEKLKQIHEMIKSKIEGEEHMFSVDALMEHGEKAGEVIDEMKAKFKLDREKRRLEEEAAAMKSKQKSQAANNLMDQVAGSIEIPQSPPQDPASEVYAFRLEIVFNTTLESAKRTAAGIRDSLPQCEITMKKGARIS